MKHAISIFILLFSLQLQAQSWTEIAEVPAPGRDDGIAFSLDGSGYIVTGNQSGFSESNKLFQYSISSNTWMERTPFPGTARQYSSVFTIKNKAYLIGGYSEAGNALNDVWSYDALEDTWQQLSNFPAAARWHATATSIHNTGYFGMGTTADSTLSDFWKYNPEFDTWQQLNNYPAGGLRSVLALPILNNIVCGEGFSINPITYSPDWFLFNTETETWGLSTPFPGGLRSYGTAISNGRTGIVSGGMDENSVFQNDCYALDNFGEWKALPDLPLVGLKGSKGFFLGGQFIIGTGLDNNLQRISNFYSLASEEIVNKKTMVFPNPSNSNFTILGEALAKVSLHRLSGQVYGTYTIQEGGYLELNNLPAGLYLAVISTSEKTEILKLVKY